MSPHRVRGLLGTEMSQLTNSKQISQVHVHVQIISSSPYRLHELVGNWNGFKLPLSHIGYKTVITMASVNKLNHE